MGQYIDQADGGYTNQEAHHKAFQRLFGAGIPLHYNANSLKVTQRGAGANMSVDVAAGDVNLVFPNNTHSCWGFTDATVNVPISAADPSNPRVDVLVVYFDSTAVSNLVTNSDGALLFHVEEGTPAGSPTIPSDSTIQTALGANVPFVRLADITVGAAATSITNANINDRRTQLLPSFPITNDNLSTDEGELGGEWETWVPTFTGFTLGNGTMTAKKTKIGKTVKFRVKVVLGSTSSFAGSTTPVLISLPSTSSADIYMQGVTTIGSVDHNDPSASSTFPGGLLWETTTTALLVNYAIPSGSYVKNNRSDSNDPFTWVSGDAFTIIGEYEEA